MIIPPPSPPRVYSRPEPSSSSQPRPPSDYPDASEDEWFFVKKYTNGVVYLKTKIDCGSACFIGGRFILTSRHIIKQEKDSIGGYVIFNRILSKDEAGKPGVTGRIECALKPGEYFCSPEEKDGDLDFTIIAIEKKMELCFFQPYALPFFEKTSERGGEAFVLQYPETSEPYQTPQKSRGAFGEDRNHYIYYQALTAPRSSGGAVFDQKANWIALHKGTQEESGRHVGILIDKIKEYLIGKKKWKIIKKRIKEDSFYLNPFRYYYSTQNTIPLLISGDRKPQIEKLYTQPYIFIEENEDVAPIEQNPLKQDLHTFGNSQPFSHLHGYKKPVKLETLFEHVKGDHYRVIIYGAAGTGKSTLCHYIAYQWSNGKLWSEMFTHLVWIRLRNFHCNSLGEYLTKEYGLEDPNLARNFIEDKSLRSRTLLIFDGYDEVPSRQSEKLIKELLDRENGFPHWIITSRPQTIPSVPQETCEMEIMGFDPDGVKEYINKFFTEKEKKDNSDLIEQLQKPDIKSLCSIPINLQMFCWLPVHRRKQSILSDKETVTKSCTELIDWWLRRFLIKEESSSEADIIDSDPSLENSDVRFLKGVLATIGWYAVEKSKTYLSKEEIKPLWKGFSSTFQSKDPPPFSKMRSLGPFSFNGKEGNFVHSIFKEYFAACYLSSLYLKDRKKAKEMTSSRRTDLTFRSVFTYTAGLLAKELKEISLKELFEDLCQESESCDLKERTAIMKSVVGCINECPSPKFVALDNFFRSPDFEESAIIFAIKNHQRAALKWLIESYPNLIEVAGKQGTTAMHIPALNGDVEALEWLHDKKPSLIEVAAENGVTPMHLAAFNGQIKALEWLHDKKPSLINGAANDGATPMHLAAFNGQIKALEWLHDKKSSLINGAANDGATPMHLAAFNGQIEATRWLIEVNTDEVPTPMHSAALNGNIKELKWLHKSSPQLIEVATKSGATPMHYAASEGQIEALEWLHKNSPQLIEVATKNGVTPVDVAASEGQIRALKWLIEMAADEIATPIHEAAFKGNVEELKRLYEKSSQLIEVVTKSGATPMHLAALNGHVEALKWLHEKSSKLINGAANNGTTPMHLAALNGHVEALKWLDKQDSKLIKGRGKNGATSMHNAASNGHVGALEWLYDRSSELINVYANDNSTPMHSAASNGHVEALKWLYDKEPKLISMARNDGTTPLDIARNDGTTPRDIARDNGHVEAEKWIQSVLMSRS